MAKLTKQSNIAANVLYYLRNGPELRITDMLIRAVLYNQICFFQIFIVPLGQIVKTGENNLPLLKVIFTNLAVE